MILTPQIKEFEIGLGMMKIVNEPTILSATGIGSCIALAMRDRKGNASGLAHIVLPNSKNMDDAQKNPGKYSNTAVHALIHGLLLIGVSLEDITAKIVGGSRVIETGGFDGVKNISSTRNELKRRGVEIVGEDVGLAYGRTIRFDTATGKITVHRYQQRQGKAELKDIIVI
ncbi:MAG TPA: chemotaxis protein CheD [Terriglobales bacterium]|nr:chemotaxis protein CheD [Terriglobales bacterium]